MVENKLTFSWDLCNSIRQELIQGGKPHDFAAVKARVVQMMQSPSVVPSSVPPKQSQCFGTSLPKNSESIGGKSHEEWMEMEMKKFKARQAEMWAKIRREREALQIQKDKVVDSGNKENSVIRKAESSSIYSESIKSKEASIIEKGHGKHSKTTILDFSEVNGTYFLPYELCAI